MGKRIKPGFLVRLFSTETGHDFGTWEGVDAADVIAQMAEQAGEPVDASLVEVIELTTEAVQGSGYTYEAIYGKGK